MGSKALFIGAIVVLGAVTIVGAPRPSLFRRAVDGSTMSGNADRLLAEKLEERGRIAFAKGSRAYLEQRRRMRAEGVSVVRGRVVKSAAWDLDALLWKPK